MLFLNLTIWVGGAQKPVYSQAAFIQHIHATPPFSVKNQP
jgi:hypothetical protein